MSWLSRAWAAPARERRAVSSSVFSPPGMPGLDYTVGGGGTGAMAQAAYFACVTLLADTIASLPIQAYRRDGQARVLLDPQPRLMGEASPWPDTTWFEWLWMASESMLVTGNAFWYVTERDRMERPTALMPLHPDDVSARMEESGPARWADSVYRVGGVPVQAADIVHLRRFPSAGRALGMSPTEKAAAAIGLALAAERYGLTYFRDSASPSSVLESDAPLDRAQTAQLQQQWISSHGGRRRPAILSGGVKWRPIAITPEESQFLQTRQFQRSEIAMWFRVPPHMIGDTTKSTSWGTGIEQQSIGFVTYTLRPWLKCLEESLSALLPPGVFARFNVDALLRGDVKARWEAYRLGRDNGVYSVNDIRSLEDLPPVEDGDGRLQPLNFGPLGASPPADDGSPPATESDSGEPDGEPEEDPEGDDPEGDDPEEED